MVVHLVLVSADWLRSRWGAGAGTVWEAYRVLNDGFAPHWAGDGFSVAECYRWLCERESAKLA